MYLKSIVFVFAVSLVAACTTTPQVDIDAEIERVLARSNAIVAAEVAQDTEAAMPYWATDAIIQPGGSPQIQGHDALRAMYGQFFDTGSLKEFGSSRTELRMSAAGDMAYEYGINRMVLTGPEGDALDMGKYIAVWQKIEDEWFVVGISFTSDTPAPVPIEP